RSWSLRNLGYSLVRLGEMKNAEMALRESLNLCKAAGNTSGSVAAVAAFATLLAEGGQVELATRLLGSVHVTLERLGGSLMPGDRFEYEGRLAALKAQLDPAAFSTLWQQGRALGLNQAIILALEQAN